MNVQKYFKFSGTATRSEFWGVFFITVAALMVLILVAGGFMAAGQAGALVGGLLLIATGVAYIWLTAATAVRRCRDAGINPWFAALIFVPYVTFVVYVVFGCLPSKPASE